ncbi:MAG: aconitate hydratase AcnA [Planctomycetales bacterium]|nr:aconitate hydratase AcnA [Planctomycetales bacterium]
MKTTGPFDARDTFSTGDGSAALYRISKLEDAGLCKIATLPYSIRVLLEAVLRTCDGFSVTEDDVKNVAGWNAAAPAKVEIPFKPARVVLQDFTGVPAVVDLAAMRSAMQRLGGDPKKINPLIPVDLVIDHSVQVDRFGTAESLSQNVAIEFERNQERYEFLRWGQKAFSNFRVVPPNVGIVHQVNLEYLAKGVFLREDAHGPVALPDSLVGTDSHTTMINGLGVVGWGVGGIEAEGVMLGQPIYMLMPEVIGFELTGALSPGVTATDLVLTVTQILRKAGVVEKFVEFFGPGVSKMRLADRATIANMAPEYGATMGFFPIDDMTLDYLRLTGRTKSEVQLVERYTKEQLLFRTDDAAPPTFTKTLSLDLSTVEPSLAGPKRPQDRVSLANMKRQWEKDLAETFGKPNAAEDAGVDTEFRGEQFKLKHGAAVIAAITSCTNTSNPSVMIGAGLLAKKAVEKGLNVKPWVKTSLAPGSRVVTDYLAKSGLEVYLDKLGFNTVGYGCTTCIGNSGPLPDPISAAVRDGDVVACSVLSGNRNFEGRVNAQVKANYLASPPLVVAYAIAGSAAVDLTTEPIGQDAAGADVYLKDIWPSQEEVDATMSQCLSAEMFAAQYAHAFDANEQWNRIAAADSELFAWKEDSTYIQEPPFLVKTSREQKPIEPIRGARVLCLLGDSVTTDHISPAGSIAKDSPAGKYLLAHGVAREDFNSYGSRRGNDRIMVRGTFANIRVRNQLAPGTEGGWTKYLGADNGLKSGTATSIFEAACAYRSASTSDPDVNPEADGTPLVVLAGADYGMGSSRDWAAKGTYLLGVKVVIAASFERIHRSNLVGMGVLPLVFADGQTWQSLGLTGEETFDIPDLNDDLVPLSTIQVTATSPDGASKTFNAVVRIDTPVELEYYRSGGILQTVLLKLLDA